MLLQLFMAQTLVTILYLVYRQQYQHIPYKQFWNMYIGIVIFLWILFNVYSANEMHTWYAYLQPVLLYLTHIQLCISQQIHDERPLPKQSTNGG